MTDRSDDTYEVREVVAEFTDPDMLEDTVESLERAGLDRSDISMMATYDAVTKKLGHLYASVSEVEDDGDVPQTVFADRHERAEAKAAIIGLPVYIGGSAAGLAVVASGGTLAVAALLAAAGAGAGAAIGALLSGAIDRRHAATVEDQLASGGMLLWVRVKDDAQEARVTALLRDGGGDNVHAHTLKRHWGTDDVPLHDFNPDPFLERP